MCVIRNKGQIEKKTLSALNIGKRLPKRIHGWRDSDGKQGKAEKAKGAEKGVNKGELPNPKRPGQLQREKQGRERGL